jgi:hypothetical protein
MKAKTSDAAGFELQDNDSPDSYDEDEDSDEDVIEIKIASNLDNKLNYGIQKEE